MAVGGGGDDAEEAPLPWSGTALGLADLGFIAGRAKPLVVAIVGPHNAGKTTVLAVWYRLIARSMNEAGSGRFAGSYTLSGWESVAGPLEWSPAQPPHFPPHTSSRGGRAPGLLHMSFTRESVTPRDFLFADTPGEWFRKWAVDRDAPEAEGARWLAEHADVFLFIADRDALSGPSMGSARGALQLLAKRLAAERGDRPCALVWTKADIAVSADTERIVKETVVRFMPDVVEFHVSIPGSDDGGNREPEGFVEVLGWTLKARRGRPAFDDATSSSTDPLFLYGSRSQ